MITSNKRYPVSSVYAPLSNSIGKRTTNEGFFTEDGIKVIRLRSRFEVFGRTWLRGLEKTIVELRPDIVQVNGMTRFSSFRIPVLKWLKRLKFRLIYDEHMHYSVFRKGLLGKVFYFLFRLIVRPLLLRQADAFVAITEETKVFANKECGIPLSRVQVVPLGVDHHLFRFDESSRRELRKQYDILEDDVVFIYAGKLVPGKGPHLLVEAGLKLYARYKNPKVFLLGDGPEEYIKLMKDKIGENGFDNRVIWHGGVDNKELYRFYCAADVGVWPLQESMTMLEAASCQLPIIVRNCSSLTERISNANGFGYMEGKTEDLARYMQTLLLDKELRKRMGRNGRELIEKTLTWEIIAKRYADFYSNLF